MQFAQCRQGKLADEIRSWAHWGQSEVGVGGEHQRFEVEKGLYISDGIANNVE
jgi:hypothetical protein